MDGYEQTGWILAAAFLAVWLFSMVVRTIAARLRLARHHRKLRRARDGEHDAVELLRSLGFDVLDSQVHGTWSVYVDGEPTEIALFADHLVERDGERFIAEVKTGERAPSITTAGTRRQLLEYLHAFDVDGLFLVDMEEGVAQRIDFPARRTRR